MRAAQKAIITSLLQGGNISNCQSSGYRLRTRDNIVISKFYGPTFYSLKKVLRKTKTGLYVINKSEIRQMNGNTWMKKEYKKLNVV